MLAHDHLRYRQRQHPFGAGSRRDPLVGIHAGERQARADVHELRHRCGAAGVERVRAREPVLELDRRQPGVEEVGTEGEQILRVGEVVGRQRGRAESHAIAGAHRLERERLVAHPPAAHLLHPFIDEIPERRLFGAREEDDSLPPRLAHLGGESLERAVPIDGFERPARVPHHRMGDAIGVVEPLERRLAARAQPPPIDRGVGIAFELDGPPLAHAHAHPATRRTFPAGGGVVGGRARNLILGLDQIGNQAFGGLGADAAGRQGGRAGAGHAEDLQKPPAIDGVCHVSNGTRCSRGSRCS